MNRIVPGCPWIQWPEVLKGSGWARLEDVPPELLARMVQTVSSMFWPLRQAFDDPLIVVSGGGLRSPRANKAANGKRRSKHLLGEALDLKPVDLGRCEELYDLAAAMQSTGKIPKGGLCLYREGSPRNPGLCRFVHVDIRGERERWDALHGSRWTSFRQDSIGDVA